MDDPSTAAGGQTSGSGLEMLVHASVGPALSRHHISMFPVYLHGGRAPDVLAASAALALGLIEVTETGGGSIPTLTVDSTAATPVLFPEGDTLAGGKQNRTVITSVLVPAGGSTALPVSCVEAGRWDTGRRFEHGRTIAPRRVRRTMTESMLESPYPMDRRPDQGRVWQEVDAEFARTGARSASRSLHDAVASGQQRLDAFSRLRPLPGQCGVVVTRGRRILGIDVFANPTLLDAYWASLISSYVTDLSDRPPKHRASASVALHSLRHLGTSDATQVPGRGTGTEFSVRSRHVVAGGITLDGHLIHLSAFGRNQR